MTERSWEGASRARLERVLADLLERVRGTADQIEREAKGNIESASRDNRVLEFQTYNRVAAQAVHAIQTMLFNLPLDSLIMAAADAETARNERLGSEQ